jgi:hypothetical protein
MKGSLSRCGPTFSGRGWAPAAGWQRRQGGGGGLRSSDFQILSNGSQTKQTFPECIAHGSTTVSRALVLPGPAYSVERSRQGCSMRRSIEECKSAAPQTAYACAVLVAQRRRPSAHGPSSSPPRGAAGQAQWGGALRSLHRRAAIRCLFWVRWLHVQAAMSTISRWPLRGSPLHVGVGWVGGWIIHP